MTEAGLQNKEGGSIPLLGVKVRAEVLAGHTRVRVQQRYKNDEAKPIEAVYTFPLPSNAVLVGFAMICEGRRLQAVVQEREEAFKTYSEAMTQGHGGALLEQERLNVFTANVGNLLPHEETLVEVEYVQRLLADEGALRWMLPTLVAPRYIPGAPTGNRTSHGHADPTDRVPDADRITPRIGDVAYGLDLELILRLGSEVKVESPSHKIAVVRKDDEVRVTFAQDEVALDRDVVVLARSAKTGPLAGLTAHRTGDGPGFFALSVLPDLFDAGRAPPPTEVVFVIDTSGSMDGASLPEAQAALKLCLRHLRKGDRFNIIEFNSSFTKFAPKPVAFDQNWLNRADSWVQALRANGGTELREPLVEAVKSAPDGIIVLLTDGQVGNEAEIAKAVLHERKTARVYSFGIGTNVSDALLRQLAAETEGGAEFIHPGERIDEKVTATFARALAERVSDVDVRFVGVEIGDVTPRKSPALIDGEPWVLFGRYPMASKGRVEIRGRRGGAPFTLDVPVELPGQADHPALPPMWASERIRDLESSKPRESGEGATRREAVEKKIAALAVEYGVGSACTSFVVIEHRTGDRLQPGQASTRFVPVNAPAGWASVPVAVANDLLAAAAAAPMGYSGFALGGFAGAPVAAAPASGGGMFRARRQRADVLQDAKGAVDDSVSQAESTGASVPAPPTQKPAFGRLRKLLSGPERAAPAAPSMPREEVAKKESADPIVEVLERQLASGLWDSEGTDAADLRLLRGSTRSLLALYKAGVTTSHPVHGAQVRKAIDALLPLVRQAAAAAPQLAELALSVAWVMASGSRTRQAITAVLSEVGVLNAASARFSDETVLQREVSGATV